MDRWTPLTRTPDHPTRPATASLANFLRTLTLTSGRRSDVATTDDDRATDRAKYRALGERPTLSLDAETFTPQCSTRGCGHPPVSLVRTISDDPHPYCAGCAGDRLQRNQTAREYPLRCITDTRADARIRKLEETTAGVTYELSADDDLPDASVEATNPHDDCQGDVVDLRRWR